MAEIIKKVKVMQSDGTFTDYIPLGANATNVKTTDGMSVENKLKKKPYYFNTVADMKAASYLAIGDMAITLGYYSINDGGAAEYNIIDDNGNNNDYCEELNNSLLAKLVIMNNTVIPEQFGAYGDNIHDDSFVLNQCILYCDSKQMTLLANKIYKITEPLLIDKSYLILNINELNYTGNDSAIKLKRGFCEINIYKISSTGKGILIEPRTTNTVDSNKINIDVINSDDNCIEMNAYGWGILNNVIHFIRLHTNTNTKYPIYCYSEKNSSSSHPSYIGENAFYGGKVSGGLYGIYAKSVGIDSEITALKLYNISLEGNTNGIYFDNINYSVIDYPRYQEYSTGIIWKIANDTKNCIFNGTSSINADQIDCTECTAPYLSYNEINAPIRLTNNGSLIGKKGYVNLDGLIYEPSRKFQSHTFTTQNTNLSSFYPNAALISLESPETNVSLILDKNYNYLGLNEFYVKVNVNTTLNIYGNDGTTLKRSVSGSGSGRWLHFVIDQNQDVILVGFRNV